MRKVFKFGGASVRDAAGVRNVAGIINRYPDENLVVIVSAMGKTTNALEKVVKSYFGKSGDAVKFLDEIRQNHFGIINELFSGTKSPVFSKVGSLFVLLDGILKNTPSEKYDFEYDKIVSFGELLSTVIVSEYLTLAGIENRWADVRTLIKTDNTFREATVNIDRSAKLIQDYCGTANERVILTQGFLGSTAENLTTTLGREGSDYTASVFAYSLGSPEVVLWKDVGGVFNADPVLFHEAVKFRTISYREAIELTFYGATVIHPKTIKPLQDKNIPLRVKSFVRPEEDGTLISSDTTSDSMILSYIVKPNQVLLSIMPRDFSFIVEENLSRIFSVFAAHRVKINVMQNSAVSFSVCADNDPLRVPALLKDLRKNFTILFNKDLQLFTIRHYNMATIDRLASGKKIYLEQKSRNTIQLVMK
ncbi:MAG: aspartate kinase [Bacteroidetes bacterium]|nr:aspartate kinase [Bacteroidota bacterium]